MKLFRRILFITLTFFALLVLISNAYINHKAKAFLYSSAESLPVSKYGLVLGTNKYLAKGGTNRYFEERVRAASHLYAIGKISQIIISGHTESRYYDEPGQIKKELISSGVSPIDIIVDTTGDRTYLSILNLKASGITDSVTIISQKFHNQRAVFLAEEHGIKAFGFNIPDKLSKTNYKTYLREVFAKTVAFLEVLLT